MTLDAVDTREPNGIAQRSIKEAVLYQKEAALIEQIGEGIAEREDPPVICFPKGNLTPDVKFPVDYRPDDTIEIRPIRRGDGVVVWQVRNRTIAENPPLPLPAGKLLEIRHEEVKKFADDYGQQNPVGAHRIRGILEELKRGVGNKIYGWVVDEEGREVIKSIALVEESWRTHGLLKILATMPDSVCRGYGSAVIDGLKQVYCSLRIGGVSPFGNSKNPAEEFARLSLFYRKNGFNGGEWYWQKPPAQISLDEIYRAGD